MKMKKKNSLDSLCLKKYGIKLLKYKQNLKFSMILL